MSDLRESVLPVNGIDLHVTEGGDGPALLVLHGLTLDASFEREVLDDLARDHRVVAPDLRGHGRSTRPAAYTLDDHVADVLALLDHLGLERVDVVGTSMGSYVAQGLTLAAPERVRSLVLVVSRPSGATSSTARLLAEHADEVAGLGPAEQQAWVFARMFAPSSGPDLRRRVLRWIGAQQTAGLALTPEQVRAANDALAGFDFTAGLPGVTAPTLVVSGRHDLLNPPDEGARLADLVPGARLVVFEEAGHMLSVEQPAEYLATVRAFLDGP